MSVFCASSLSTSAEDTRSSIVLLRTGKLIVRYRGLTVSQMRFVFGIKTP